MVSTDLLRVVAKHCDFTKTRLQRADMREADFERSNFSESSLLHANIDNRTSFAYAVIHDTGLEFVEDDNGAP